MMTNKKSLGLYIHIPFCVKKCNYCDFCSSDRIGQEDKRAYVNALCLELERESEKAKNYEVDTVFFGGGTPSLLSSSQLDAIFRILHNSYAVSPDAEISMEVNPATVDREKLSFIKSLGVNRLSIGMQSLNENELKILGRAHSEKDFYSAYDDARGVGFSNLNVDLMYGIPEQTLSSFERTLKGVVSLKAEHISAYSLKIEENTPFYRMKNELSLPDEDEEYAMYLSCADTLTRAGYSHYEISNYAKEGRECKHNLRYWRGLEYLGFGASAYSFFEGKRYGNPSLVSEYTEKNGECEKTDIEELSLRDEEYEYIMLAFRLREGVSDVEFARRFGIPFSEKYKEIIKKLEKSEFFLSKEGRFYLTDRGMYVSNSILCELLSCGGL
jgi:oxygen-independent coproporphyrinogen-3 oxidase